MNNRRMDRRVFLKSVAGASVAMLFARKLPLVGARHEQTNSTPMNTRSIPASGEELPVVGLGTWQQFDVDSDPALLRPLVEVLRNLIAEGGSVIDTSPMYGRAEKVIGQLLTRNNWLNHSFLATKVWTRGRENAIHQLENSTEKLNSNQLDLVQIHNLVDWKTHLPLLREWKKEEKIRYYGITHYTRSAFDDLNRVMNNEDLDFVQLPYSIDLRDAEENLLPLARDRGMAVIVNRPLGAGRLFRSVQGLKLPDFAVKWGIESWAQYFLKYIIGHPAVTCVIPGTSNPHHMKENARAGQGMIPDKQQRSRMLEYWETQAGG